MARATLSLTDAVFLAAAIVAVGGGVLGLCRAAAKIYRRTVGSRRDLPRRLNQLGAGVTTRWVEERFGTPAFVRALNWPAKRPENHDGAALTIAARELVYREKHAWLQVIADEHDAVLGPLQDPAGLIEPRGPDSNQVRVLLPGARQRWKVRWRMRRARRQAPGHPGASPIRPLTMTTRRLVTVQPQRQPAIAVMGGTAADRKDVVHRIWPEGRDYRARPRRPAFWDGELHCAAGDTPAAHPQDS